MPRGSPLKRRCWHCRCRSRQARRRSCSRQVRRLPGVVPLSSAASSFPLLGEPQIGLLEREMRVHDGNQVPPSNPIEADIAVRWCLCPLRPLCPRALRLTSTERVQFQLSQHQIVIVWTVHVFSDSLGYVHASQTKKVRRAKCRRWPRPDPSGSTTSVGSRGAFQKFFKQSFAYEVDPSQLPAGPISTSHCTRLIPEVHASLVEVDVAGRHSTTFPVPVVVSHAPEEEGKQWMPFESEWAVLVANRGDHPHTTPARVLRGLTVAGAYLWHSLLGNHLYVTCTL